MKAAAVYSLDPAREERGEGRPDSSSHSPLLPGRGAAAHTRAHALHSSSCCFPSPQASAVPPVLVPHYLPGISLLVCLSVCVILSVCQCHASPCACLHVQPCLRVSRSPRACLAPRNGSGCPGLPAHLRPCVFLLSYARVPASPCVRLPAPACVSACICTSASTGPFYPGKQDRHVHPSPVRPSWLELRRLRAKTKDREEEEGRGK